MGLRPRAFCQDRKFSVAFNPHQKKPRREGNDFFSRCWCGLELAGTWAFFQGPLYGPGLAFALETIAFHGCFASLGLQIFGRRGIESRFSSFRSGIPRPILARRVTLSEV